MRGDALKTQARAVGTTLRAPDVAPVQPDGAAPPMGLRADDGERALGDVLLRADGISLRFGGVHALTDISF